MWGMPDIVTSSLSFSRLDSQTYLGFDFGVKSLGIAVGQSVTHTAQPLTTLKMLTGAEPNWQLLDPIVHEWQPTAFVVGLALQPDGEQSKTSVLAHQFGKKLQQRYQQPVHYIDERLSSVAARASLRERTRLTSREKAEIDRISAAIILESWLNELTIPK